MNINYITSIDSVVYPSGRLSIVICKDNKIIKIDTTAVPTVTKAIYAIQKALDKSVSTYLYFKFQDDAEQILEIINNSNELKEANVILNVLKG